MATCAQPGCSGTIEDGYCDACGMATAAAKAAANAGAGSQRTGSAHTTGTMSTSGTGATGATGTRGSGRTPSGRSARSVKSTRSGSSSSNRSGRSISGRSNRGGGTHALARPALPPQEPLDALVPGVVPEKKRHCSNCDSALRREAGFCPSCGQEYSFKPTLSPGDVVAGKYEIKGTIAFGGLGWIYLGLDTVLNRWVILKGLLNSKDPRMLEVAVQEREYLAAVKHPNIVGIYDFLTRETPSPAGPPGTMTTEGFIVLEYVNGKTLMALRKENGGPLPPAQACSYICEILPSLQYLADMDLAYCDFKPENVMVEEETVKLIDMGAVRHVDATGGDIYGSKGYTAPEAHETPTPLSDLYSVGRALAILVASFDFQGKYEESLPPPEEVPVFAQHDALYRFLLKATQRAPEERFANANEMAEQLLGVLHGLVDDPSQLGKLESALFESDGERFTDSQPLSSGAKKGPGSDGFPRVRVDKADAAAGVILAAGALTDPERRRAMFARALKTAPDSVELRLRLVDELVTLGKFTEAERELETAQKARPGDWRIAWYRGRSLLVQGRTKETMAAFDKLANDMPGELAPRHVLGQVHERSGDLARAISYYDGVSRADPTFASAAMALARCREQLQDRAGAVEAYKRVPPTSHRFINAQLALANLYLSDVGGTASRADVEAAGLSAGALEGVFEGKQASALRASIFAAGIPFAGDKTFPDAVLLGVPWLAASLRRAAEDAYRACARAEDDEHAKYALVDRANEIRPMTWF